MRLIAINSSTALLSRPSSSEKQQKSTIKVSKFADITCVPYFKTSETLNHTFVIVHKLNGLFLMCFLSFLNFDSSSPHPFVLDSAKHSAKHFFVSHKRKKKQVLRNLKANKL